MAANVVRPDPLAPAQKPLFDLSNETEKQRALLAIFGLFIILPVSYFSAILTFIVFQDQGMAMVGGLTGVMVAGGFLGFLTVLVQQAVRNVNIRVVQEKE